MSKILRSQLSALNKKLNQRDQEIKRLTDNVKLWNEAHGALFEIILIAKSEMITDHSISAMGNKTLDELLRDVEKESDGILKGLR